MKLKELFFIPIAISLAFVVSNMFFFGPYLEPIILLAKGWFAMNDDKTFCFFFFSYVNFLTVISIFIVNRFARILGNENLARRVRKSALTLTPLMFLSLSNVLVAYIFKVQEIIMVKAVMILSCAHMVYFYTVVSSSSVISMFVEALILSLNLLLLFVSFFKDIRHVVFHMNSFGRFFEGLFP